MYIQQYSNLDSDKNSTFLEYHNYETMKGGVGWHSEKTKVF